MGKRVEYTPKSKIRAALRNVWLRSRERAAALKRDNYTCQTCKRKQTLAKGKEFKVVVHHINHIDWDGVTELVSKRILQTPDNLVTLCNDCHDKIHENDK